MSLIAAIVAVAILLLIDVAIAFAVWMVSKTAIGAAVIAHDSSITAEEMRKIVAANEEALMALTQHVAGKN